MPLDLEPIGFLKNLTTLTFGYHSTSKVQDSQKISISCFSKIPNLTTLNLDLSEYNGATDG